MRVESRFLVNEKWLVDEIVPAEYDEVSTLAVKTNTVKGDCLELATCTQFSTSGLIVLDVEMFFTAQETDLFTIDGDCVVMDFMYSNNVHAEVEELNNPDYRNPNVHNIWYTSGFKGNYVMPPFQKIKYMVFIFSRDFYNQLFSVGREAHPEFSGNIKNSNASYLSPNYLPFNPAIQWALQEIRDCRRTGIFKRIFLETKIRELILIQLEMYAQSLVQSSAAINHSDLSKLQQAKQILDAEFVHPPSLIELSRKIALNEFKLKKGFKQCFGDTVRSYIIKLRMNHSRKLLKSRNLSVGDVAYQCGYKDISHFSSAFKSHFGFSPRQMLEEPDNL